MDLLPYIDQHSLRDLWDDRDENEAWVAATVQLDDEQLMKFYPALAVYSARWIERRSSDLAR